MYSYSVCCCWCMKQPNEPVHSEKLLSTNILGPPWFHLHWSLSNLWLASLQKDQEENEFLKMMVNEGPTTWSLCWCFQYRYQRNIANSHVLETTPNGNTESIDDKIDPSHLNQNLSWFHSVSDFTLSALWKFWIKPIWGAFPLWGRRSCYDIMLAESSLSTRSGSNGVQVHLGWYAIN